MQAAIILFTIAMVIVIAVILISFGVLYKEVKGKINPGGGYYNVYKNTHTGELYTGERYETLQDAHAYPGREIGQYLGTIKI